MSPASARTLKPMPAINDRRKPPLMCFQNSLNLPRKNRPSALLSICAIEPTNSSYMPVMNAMVPPDTPGMTSAAPMQAPLVPIIR